MIVIIMSGKIIKAAIFSLVTIMLLSMVFPGGVSSEAAGRSIISNLHGLDDRPGYEDPNYSPN